MYLISCEHLDNITECCFYKKGQFIIIRFLYYQNINSFLEKLKDYYSLFKIRQTFITNEVFFQIYHDR